MKKLLAKFRQTQSAADALKLLAYVDRHPVGFFALTFEDQDIVNDLSAKRARAIHAVSCAKAA